MEAVNSLACTRLGEYASDLLLLDRRIADECSKLSALLYTEISAIADRKHRNRLLQVRRDLFKGRRLTGSVLDFTDTVLPPLARNAVRAVNSLLDERDAATYAFRALYEEETWVARGRFQALIEDADFQKGLLLSSRSLFRNIGRYKASSPATFRSRDEQIERGLLRYFTRAATKATPFGTFCGITAGTIEFDSDNAGPVLSFLSDPRPKRTMVRLNKALFGVLWGHLKSRPAVRRTLTLVTNSTTSLDGDRFAFLSVTDGSECFQRLGRNDAIDVVLALTSQAAGALYSDLIKRLVSDPRLDTSHDEALAYVDSLIGIGLLRFRGVVADQDVDWAEALCHHLQAIDDDDARCVVAGLRTLGRLAVDYEQSGIAARALLLSRAQEEVSAMLTMVGLERGMARLAMPFFEDAAAEAAVVIRQNPKAEAVLNALYDYVEITSKAAWLRTEQATMRHFYDRFYGPSRPAVPLLQYYEDYYREHIKKHLENHEIVRQRGPRALVEYDTVNPFGLEFVRSMGEAWNRLYKLLRQCYAAAPKAEEVEISAEAVAEALSDLPAAVRPLSTTIFCQAVADPVHGTRIVVRRGSYMPGYGKYFSRFLYLVPRSIQQTIVAENERLSTDILAEIAADANFNGNLHPALVSSVLSYPTGEAPSENADLSCTDLEVVRAHDDEHALRLVHRPTGRCVTPLDLGFLNPVLRPPLFKVLASFAPGATFHLQVEDGAATATSTRHSEDGEGSGAAAARSGEPGERIEYLPRIVYGRHIVVARRRWSVPASLFPRYIPGEAAADAFLRVQRWRSDAGIPRQIYVRLYPMTSRSSAGDPPTARPIQDEGPSIAKHHIAPEPAAADDTEQPPAATVSRNSPARSDRVSRDFKKPQYIDFYSPLLVSLFIRLPGEVTHFRVLIEECYPDASALATWEGESFATELVLQVNVASDQRSSG